MHQSRPGLFLHICLSLPHSLYSRRETPAQMARGGGSPLGARMERPPGDAPTHREKEPHETMDHTPDATPTPALSIEDLQAALRDMSTYIDVTPEDLQTLYTLALGHARARRVTA